MADKRKTITQISNDYADKTQEFSNLWNQFLKWCNLKIYPTPVLSKSIIKLISLIVLELFLFSDFSIPLSALRLTPSNAYSLAPASKLNGLSKDSQAKVTVDVVRAIVR